MTFTKGAVFLLLLAAVSINAEANDCDVWNKTIPVKDLQQVLGEWTLVWAISDHQEGRELLGNLSSSHAEITHIPDESILSFVEGNRNTDDTCNRWMINMTIPAEPEEFTLHVSSSQMEKDGVTQTLNDTEEVVFYNTGNGTVLLRWKDTKGVYVMIYNKEGHRMEAEQLKEDQESYLKLADCLTFPQDAIYTFNSTAEFCHKNPAPEAVIPEVDATKLLEILASS